MDPIVALLFLSLRCLGSRMKIMIHDAVAILRCLLLDIYHEKRRQAVVVLWAFHSACRHDVPRVVRFQFSQRRKDNADRVWCDVAPTSSTTSTYMSATADICLISSP